MENVKRRVATGAGAVLGKVGRGVKQCSVTGTEHWKGDQRVNPPSSSTLTVQKKGAFQLTVTSFSVQAPISSFQQVWPVHLPLRVEATGSLKLMEFGPPESTPGGTRGDAGSMG